MSQEISSSEANAMTNEFKETVSAMEEAELARQSLTAIEEMESESKTETADAEKQEAALENSDTCTDCSGSCWLTCSGSDKWAYRT